MPERRPARKTKCAFDGCDWWVTTAEFVGGPHFVQERSKDDVMAEAQRHMERAHFGKTKQVFT